jgi:hypothetical protein
MCFYATDDATAMQPESLKALAGAVLARNRHRNRHATDHATSGGADPAKSCMPRQGHDDPLPPLPRAAEARQQKVLAMLGRAGGRYAILVEDPNTDPVVMALTTPVGTCEVRVPKDRYDPFAIAAMVAAWNQEEDL